MAFSAAFRSAPTAPSMPIRNSNPSWTSGPLALAGFESHLSAHLLNLPSITLPVPVWFLNLEIVLPAPPIAPVNKVPSRPNFNLFKISWTGSPVSLSISVGPPSQSPNVPASSTSPTKTASAAPPANAPWPNRLIFSPPLKYLPAFFAVKAALVKPLPILKANPPGIPMLTISSVIFPAAVASAASSKGLISAKNCSTASARSLSTPKSIRVAPKVAAPSKILKTPEPIPAAMDVARPTSSLAIV